MKKIHSRLFNYSPVVIDFSRNRELGLIICRAAEDLRRMMPGWMWDSGAVQLIICLRTFRSFINEEQ